MNKISFIDWSQRLEQVWDIDNEKKDEGYYELMDAITGDEDVCFLHKIIESIRVPEDNGVYESTYNAIWSFPQNIVGKTLAEILPSFQKRMGEHDQVSRFYLPIPSQAEVRKAFVNSILTLSSPEKQIVETTIKEWSAEDEEWESILAELGKPVAKVVEETIPSNWNEEWKTRLLAWRNMSDVEKAKNKLFWNKGKKEWLQDLDFLIATLTLQHGKDWRIMDTWTNPLWIYARTVTYPTFIEKLRSASREDQEKVLENMKRVNKLKYNTLVKELEL